MLEIKWSFSQTNRIGNNGFRGFTLKKTSSKKMLPVGIEPGTSAVLRAVALLSEQPRHTLVIFKLSFVPTVLESWT